MKREPIKERCYHCLKDFDTEMMTDDHVPPCSIFFPGTPDRIKVRACKPCNHSYHLDDEAFMMWLTFVRGENKTKKWRFEKVVAELKKPEKAKLLKNIQKSFSISYVKSGEDFIPVPTTKFPAERAQRMLRRMTMALLAKFHSDYDYSNDVFLCQAPAPTPSHIRRIQEIQSISKKDSRGGNDFIFWRSIAHNDRAGVKNVGGLWVFLFYGEACFTVIHSNYQLTKTRLVTNGAW